MENSNLFDADEEKSRKFYSTNGFKAGVIIIPLSLFTGLILLPMYVNDDIEPIIVPALVEPETPYWQEEQEQKSEDTTHDIQKTSESVKLTISSGFIKSYKVETEGKWAGDYIDGNEIPSGITLEGNKSFQFRCYEDSILGTSTYFGAFKNLEGNPIKVTVMNGNQILEEKSSTINHAVVLEGHC